MQNPCVPPAESPVGDQRAVAPAAGTFHGPCDGEHLAHAGPALWPFVTDDYHCARLDRSGQDRLESRLLAVEDPGDTLEVVEVETRNLYYPAGRRQRTPKDRNPPISVDRVGQGMDDLAVGSRRVERREVLGQSSCP